MSDINQFFTDYEYLSENDYESMQEIQPIVQKPKHQNTNTVVSGDNWDVLEPFSVKFNGVIRNFLTQKTESVINKEPWYLTFKDVTDLQTQLWPKILPSIQREIIFERTTPTWSPQEVPEIDSFEQFVNFYDAKSRRTFSVSTLSPGDLNRWCDGRVINVNVYAFSMSINSKTAWSNVEKCLLTPANQDRAGAAAESELHKLTAQLKSTHEANYQALWINWKAWADYIMKQPAQFHDRLMKQPPPSSLIHLFSCARLPADIVMGDLRQNVNIATTLNEGISKDVEEINKTTELILKQRDDINRSLDLLFAQQKSLKEKLANHGALLEVFGHSTNVQENEFGVQMYNNIGFMEDHDHL
jgi:hypothetical protein